MYISNFINLIYCNFFQPCRTEPTRIICKNESSLIDHIFINTCTQQLNAGHLVDKISDHRCMYVCMHVYECMCAGLLVRIYVCICTYCARMLYLCKRLISSCVILLPSSVSKYSICQIRISMLVFQRNSIESELVIAAQTFRT